MVLLHYKGSEKNQFIVEGSTTEIDINNYRQRIEKLLFNLEGLCQHGPLRPEALRGLTTPETYQPAVEMLPKEYQQYAYPKPNSNQIENPDKTGYRIGIAPSDQIQQKMKEVIEKGKQLIDVKRAEKRKTLSIQQLKDILLLIKGSVMIAYPGYHGLPEWDPVYILLEDKENVNQLYPNSNWLVLDQQVMWWAKKKLNEDKLLKDYIGSNEKTKIVVKFNQKGQGAPMNEPPVDKETQKKMMAYYYKKQEQQKKLEESNDDAYLYSEWANPNNLRNQLINGGRNIRFK